MLEKAGNVRKAADALFISHSALSHQIKELENRLAQPLFIRNSTPVIFTEAGQVLLTLAQEILPKVNQAKRTLKGEAQTPATLKIAINCHACFQWLLPVTDYIQQHIADLSVNFIDDDFSQHALAESDLVFTDEKHETSQDNYLLIGEFEVVAVLTNQHPLTEKPYVSAQDFIDQTVLTYPVNHQQLDVFKLFLQPQNIMPLHIKQVHNSHMILQMVAANMGISTLPDWLVTSSVNKNFVSVKRLGKQGVFKKLYAKYPKNSAYNDIIEQLIPRATHAFNALYPEE